MTAENEALKERLRAEEERRRALADKSQVKFALCNDALVTVKAQGW